MATVYIPTQSVSWSGTPRSASPQYIQSAINSGGGGNTYILEAGNHRGQAITLDTGDRLLLARNAVLDGAEVVGSGGWSNNGNGTWTKAVQSNDRRDDFDSFSHPGYDAPNLEKLIFDGQLIPWVTNSGNVDEWHAYYDGSNATIGRNPSTISLLEISRAWYIKGDGVEFGGETTEERNKVYGYCGAVLANGATERGAIHITGPNPVIHDLDIFACTGNAIAIAPGGTVRNLDVHENGQAGCGGDSALQYHIDGIVMAEGCKIWNNGVGGWNLGWEGGNCKWAWTENLVVRGSFWESGVDPRFTTLDNQPTSAMWLDVSNDGYRIGPSNIFSGLGHQDWRGGIFLEISYSGKIWDNIVIDAGYGGESEFWQGGCVSDFSGAFPGTSIDATIEVYNNLFYATAGGFNVKASGAHDNDTGWYGTYLTQYHDIHDNTVFLLDDASFEETIGIVNGGASNDPSNNDFDDNIYLVPSALSRYNDEDQGGAGGNLSFSQWQGAGRDTGSRAAQLVGSGYDPDPFNGGAL